MSLGQKPKYKVVFFWKPPLTLLSSKILSSTILTVSSKASLITLSMSLSSLSVFLSLQVVEVWGSEGFLATIHFSFLKAFLGFGLGGGRRTCPGQG